MAKTNLPSTYKTLFQKVKQTLILGQQKIEAEKVKVYWETGKAIHTHILKHKDRGEYGVEVTRQLSDDLKINLRLLQRCVQFAKTYPDLEKMARGPLFTWSHYRELISVPEEKKRGSFETAILKNQWTRDELAAQIKSSRGKSPAVEKQPPAPQTLLTPRRGEVYTYRIIQRPLLKGRDADSPLQLDLGFGVFRDVETRTAARFSPGQIVESRKKEDAYSLAASERAPKDLFTYAAVVERVIDGDTVKVKIDLGFGIWHRETLRLRDIDCPEADTKDGAAAKTFVQALLKEAAQIVLYTTRSDKYDRYLADVFIPAGDEPDPQTDVYLNNLLLEEKYAWRV